MKVTGHRHDLKGIHKPTQAGSDEADSQQLLATGLGLVPFVCPPSTVLPLSHGSVVRTVEERATIGQELTLCQALSQMGGA